MARKYNIDEIASMSDDELGSKLRNLRSYITRTEPADVDAEEDMCYFQREVEIRQIRRQAHEDWLRTHRPVREQVEQAA